MKLSLATSVAAISIVSSEAAFTSHPSTTTTTTFHSSTSSTRPTTTTSTSLKGYLDDLSADLYKEDATPDVEADLRENNQMDKSQLDRFGPGNLNEFVDFEEFDGGDGQMGVAGDGSKGLDKSEFEVAELGKNVAQQMSKSRMRSAKNAWGSSTGYADKLMEERGMDTARAQQLENWHTQQEINAKKRQQEAMASAFEEEKPDEDWRALAKFGVERTTEVDLDEQFGAASAMGGEFEGTIELKSAPNTVAIHQFSLKNPYMGFADFRAAMTPDSAACWSVDPAEGALQKTPTDFTVKFRPEQFGTFEGALVIETEDFKKTWKLIGSTG